MRRALITAGCALALGGCGAGGGSKDSASKPPQRIPLATFNCGQWSVARADIRQTVLDELHGFYGGPVSGKRRTQAYGTVLSDSEATRLFDTLLRAALRRPLHDLQALRAGRGVRGDRALDDVGRLAHR